LGFSQSWDFQLESSWDVETLQQPEQTGLSKPSSLNDEVEVHNETSLSQMLSVWIPSLLKGGPSTDDDDDDAQGVKNFKLDFLCYREVGGGRDV
jgi:hypothetical protein